MNKNNIEIKNKFDFFSELLFEEKIISSSSIILQPKINNNYWYAGLTNLSHITIPEDIVFIVEKSKRDNKYGIKLRCSNLTKEPFFRFDSDGPAHRNENSEIPLEQQSISTPHFNTFDENGKSIAYKNKTLLKENESKAIVDDINFGLSLFCMETNCKLNNGKFPIISEHSPELELNLPSLVNFDNIIFE